MSFEALKAQLAVLKAKALVLKAANRWPAGSPQSKGGQFAPKTVGSGSAPAKMFYGGGQQQGGFASNTFHESGWEGSGMWSKPKTPPPGAKPHPQTDDKGKPVSIDYPTRPSHASTWTNPAKTATFVPGGDAPSTLNGVPMKPWNPPKEGWAKVGGTDEALDRDFPFEPHPTKKTGAGVLIVEPDGRVWLTRPTNAFGGYQNTYPKGTAESGLTLQQNAIKEAYEETGLKVKIVGVLGDYERDTSKARMYIAERVGGTPKNMGWESQAMRLAPLKEAHVLLNKPHDKEILDDLANIMGIAKAAGAPPGAPAKGGAWQRQPRWPKGTALGGQWKTVGASGITEPPAIAGGLQGSNAVYQKVANAAYAAAQAGDLVSLGAAIDKYKANAQKFAQGQKTSSHVKWGAQVHQYATQAMTDVLAKTSATASADAINGPIKLTEFKQVGAKPGGSNPGALYTHPDEPSSVYLVKGNKQLQIGAVTQAVSDDRAKNEVLASKLLLAAGVGAPTMGLVDLGKEHGGGLGVASLMVSGAAAFNPNNAAHVAAAQADFAVHAWLANYDVLGMGYDNTVIKDGKAINIDPGGAILFRAQGLPKQLTGGVLDASAPEFESMRSTTGEQKKVFGSMTKEQLTASAQKLAEIDDATIKKLVSSYGPGDAAAKAKLADNLIARKNAILAKAGLATPGFLGASAPAAAPAAAKPAAPSQSEIKAAAEKTLVVLAREGKKIVENIKPESYKVMPPMLSKSAAEHHKTLVAAIKIAAEKGDLEGLGTAAATAKMNLALAKQAGDKTDDASEVWLHATDQIANLKAKIAEDAKKIAEHAPIKASPGAMEKPKFTASSENIVKFYTALADKAQAMHAAGDLAGLKALADDKKSGKYFVSHASPNSKLLQGHYNALVQDLEGKSAASIVANANAANAAVSKPVENPPKPKEVGPASTAAMPDFDSKLLSAENTNSASFNSKLMQLKNVAQNGDVKAILSMSYGTNTYGKKLAKLANSALAALGSPHNVLPGQKANAHPALTGGATPAQVVSAAATVGAAAPQPTKTKAPAQRAGWLDLKPGEKVIEQGEAFGVKWAKVETPAKGYDPTAIPMPPDFFNNGTQGPSGKWKSSKKEVNDANNAAVNLIYSTATNHGTPDKVKNLEFDVVDKNTGVPTGQKIKIDAHPAGGVKEYHTQVLSELQAQLKTGSKTYQSGSFTGGYSKAASQLASNFKKKAYAEFKAHTRKAADYLVLSQDGASNLPVPQAGQFNEMKPGMKVHDNFKKASDDAFSKLTSAEKQAAKAYTGSSYSNWNDALRTGEVDSSHFKSAQPLVKAFEKAAVEIPEGTILWRGIGVGQSTYESVVGGVIQDGSFNSASYGSSPAFSSHSTWLRIHVAKGVKGVHATSFSGFGTGEREIIVQNNVRYAVLKVEHHKVLEIDNIMASGPNKKQKFTNKTIVDVIALPHDAP